MKSIQCYVDREFEAVLGTSEKPPRPRDFEIMLERVPTSGAYIKHQTKLYAVGAVIYDTDSMSVKILLMECRWSIQA